MPQVACTRVPSFSARTRIPPRHWRPPWCARSSGWGRRATTRSSRPCRPSITETSGRSTRSPRSAAPAAAPGPPENNGNEREIYKIALQRNREGFPPDGRNSIEAAQHVYKVLEAFEPAVKGAKIDLSKTFDNHYVEAALKRHK